MIQKPVIDGQLIPQGFAQINAAAASGLGIIPTAAHLVMVQSVGADIYWRDDGTAAAAGVGMLLQDGVAFLYNGKLSAFSMIGSANVNVSFYSAPTGKGQ